MRIPYRRVGPVFVRTLLSAGILAGGIAVFVGLGRPEELKRDRRRHQAVPVVETVEAAPHDLGIDFDVDGVVVPFREIAVSPEVGGRVVYKAANCRLGSYVRKGECLFRIDKRNYELEVRRLTQESEQAKNSVAECEVEIVNTERQIDLAKRQLDIKIRELKRYQSVKDPGVFSKSQVDSALQDELAARNSLQQLENQLRLSRAKKVRLETARETMLVQLDRAHLDLERTEVLSPIDGIVTRYNVEENTYLQPGTEAVAVQDVSRLEIRCSLHMEEVRWLWQTSDPTDIQSESAPAPSFNAYRLPRLPVIVEYHLDDVRWAWTGYLNSYDGPGIDRNTRMVPCRVTVDSPMTARPTTAGGTAEAAPPTLLAGMFVTVRLHAAPKVPLLRIPETALIPGDRVWSVVDGRLRKHSVRVARIVSDGVIIYAENGSLHGGDQVVVSPLASPVDGTNVTAVAAASLNRRVSSEVAETRPSGASEEKKPL